MSEYVPVAVRRRVRQRAKLRCEYCLMPEGLGFFPHEVDHIVAIRHEGVTELTNLAWACFECNRLKGTDLASVDLETGKVVRLFNPRQDKWTTHFRWDGSVVRPRTAIGRVTEHLLRFNTPEQVRIRAWLMSADLYPTS